MCCPFYISVYDASEECRVLIVWVRTHDLGYIVGRHSQASQVLVSAQ